MIKKIVFFSGLVIFILLVNSFVQSILDLWQKQNLITETKDELARVKEENITLKTQQKQVNAPMYQETQARNKLFFVKPGEQIVVLPTQVVSKQSDSSEKEHKNANWQQWLSVFFGEKEN